MRDAVTRDEFSSGCPRCGSPDIRPVTQQNHFTNTPPAGESAHTSTSRGYECHKCGHKWEETVPHPR